MSAPKYSMKRVIVSLIPLALASLVFAEPLVLLQENFEEYTDNAALDLLWPKVGNAVTQLAVDPDNSENSVLFSKGDRRDRPFDPVVPTDAQPLHLRVDFYDDYKAGVSGREYVGLWTGVGNPENLIEVGLFNGGPGVDTGYYTARVFGSEHGSTWFDLSTSRKSGWRTIDIWVYATAVDIYFDNELDVTVSWGGGSVGVVRLGFGAGSGSTASLTGVRYDNLLIEQSAAGAGNGTVIELSDAQISGDPFHLYALAGKGSRTE